MQLTQQPPFNSITSKDIAFYAWLLQFVQNVNGIFVPVPATHTSPGIKGQISFDDNFFYVCIETNSWKRTGLVSW